MDDICDATIRALEPVRASRPCGSVISARPGMLCVQGLGDHARIGALATLRSRNRHVVGEVVGLEGGRIHVLTGENGDGVAVGDRVVLNDVPEFAPSDRWIGRIIDPYGRPLDGSPILPGSQLRQITSPPPAAPDRRPMGTRLRTGRAVFDTLLPLARGQRIGLFSGSGVGKSRLIAELAQNVSADVAVIALIGERGREVAEFARDTLGPEGMRRTVIVAATSDQTALVRRRCAWAAMSVAEHFRDQGRHVLLLADSLTRFAEAQREVAAVSGEDLTLRGYPPSLTPALTALCERAGPGSGSQGDITAIFSVLVAGSDMEGPVADIVRGVLDGHVVLSREIAERGRFPAIDVLKSVSRALPSAASETENRMIQETRTLLGAYEKSAVMIQAGLYSEGSDPVLDRAVKAWPELDSFFTRTGAERPDDSFGPLGVILRRAGVDPAVARRS